MATPESMRESAAMLRAAAARMIHDAEELERLAGDRCGKPDPEGRPCTLAAGHAHPNDHSGEVRTHPRPIGRISPETEAFVRHLHGGDAVFKTDLDFQAEQILTRYALGISRSSPTG